MTTDKEEVLAHFYECLSNADAVFLKLLWNAHCNSVLTLANVAELLADPQDADLKLACSRLSLLYDGHLEMARELKAAMDRKYGVMN